MKYTKHKKAMMITLILVVVIIAILLGLYNAGNYYFSDTRIIEENWNITLPANTKEEYSKNGKTDFQGHGSRYAVFKISRSNAPFLKETSGIKNIKMEKTVAAVLNDIGVAQNDYPKFSDSYLWRILSKYNDKLYIVYDNKSALLYLIQDMP